jgi:hypothetical protein
MQNQARRDFSYNESLNARLVHFLRKEATKKEAAKKEEAKKEAAERGGGRRGRPVGLAIGKQQ